MKTKDKGQTELGEHDKAKSYVLKVPEVKVLFEAGDALFKGKALKSSGDVAKFLRTQFKKGEIELQEQFLVMFLNRANKIIGFYRHSKGSHVATVVDNNIILSAAIQSLSSSVILAHNHPSGNIKPSREDINLTRRLIDQFKLFKIQVLDHIILTKDSYSSLADEGEINGLTGFDKQNKSHSLNQHLASKSKTSQPKKPRRSSLLSKKEEKPNTKNQVMTTAPSKKVASVNKEIQLIKRFVNMLGKDKSKKQILYLLKMIQKYLFERRARRVYKYAQELEEIEQFLFKAFQKQNDIVLIKLSRVKEKHYRSIAGLEIERIAVQFIKSYLSLQGKNINKAKVKALYNRIADAINNNDLSKRNRHWKHIQRILDSLKNYYHSEILTIHTTELRGLQGIVNLDSDKKKVETKVAKRGFTPNEILGMTFDMLGLTGKWQRLFGDVPSLFYFMIWGGAGSGKSTLAIEFAYYLAEKLNKKVCYVAEEQKISFSLQSIIKRLGLQGDKLIFEPNIASDYSGFDLVFIDSITTLGLTGKDLEKLIRSFPNTSFVFLLQSTKGSKNFRGGNDILHLLDTNVVVERQDENTSIARIDDKNRYGGKESIEVWFG